MIAFSARGCDSTLNIRFLLSCKKSYRNTSLPVLRYTFSRTYVPDAEVYKFSAHKSPPRLIRLYSRCSENIMRLIARYYLARNTERVLARQYHPMADVEP